MSNQPLATEITYDLIDELSLNPQVENDIQALLERCFDTDFGGRSFYQQRHHVRFLARSGDQLIGHIAVGFRAIRLGDALIDVTTVAEVATHPDSRGLGVAGNIMDMVIAQSRSSVAQFVMLFGDRPLYRAKGFQNVANSMIWSDLTDAKQGQVKTGADPDLMVLPLRDIVWDDAAELDLLGHKF